MPRPNSRNPEDDPAATLGRQLRRLRLTAGFSTQSAFAARLGYGQDVVSKAETGAQPPSDDVFPLWLDACQASQEAREILAGLLPLARRARGPIPQFIEKWLEREKEADFLRLWAPVLVPGLLQVEEYIRRQFEMTDMDEDQIKDSAAVRIGRQSILDGPDPVHVTALLHQSVLYRLVGTPEAMGRQIAHLLEMSRRRNLVIQVVRDTGYFPGLAVWFEIANGPGMPDTVVTVAIEDQVTDDRDMVRKAAALFQEIHGRALPAEESRMVLTEAKEHWESQQSTRAGARPATAPTAARGASR